MLQPDTFEGKHRQEFSFPDLPPFYLFVKSPDFNISVAAQRCKDNIKSQIWIVKMKKNMFTCTQAHRPSDLLKLREEVVDHVFDLRGLGREQDELFIGQVELQHVLGRDRHEEDVRVAAQEVIRSKRKGPEVKSLQHLAHLADLALCFMRE